MKDKLIGVFMVGVVAGIVVLGAKNNTSTCCPIHDQNTVTCDTEKAEEPACETESCAVTCDKEAVEKQGCEVEGCDTITQH